MGRGFHNVLEALLKSLYNILRDCQIHEKIIGSRLFKILGLEKKTIKWVKVFKNGPSKICGRQHLKKLKLYGLPSKYTPHKFYIMHFRRSKFSPQLELLLVSNFISLKVLFKDFFKILQFQKNHCKQEAFNSCSAKFVKTLTEKTCNSF